MLEWRLKAFRRWQTMTAPDWAKLDIPPIDYQDIYYYSAPKQAEKLKSLDEEIVRNSIHLRWIGVRRDTKALLRRDSVLASWTRPAESPG